MRAKKSLGQNFLKSNLALQKIIEAGEIKKGDVILEIGPGKGALTKQLLASRCQVLAVEKDSDLYEILKTKFQKEISSGQLNLILDDILDFDITKVVRQGLTTYKIIANIPYNITGAILKKFLTAEYQPTSMVIMVQHEVAKRIMAQGGKESILSISVKAYGEGEMIMKVPARYFSPSPKVDSAVIAIKNISRKLFFHPGASATPKEGNINEEKFWNLVKTGFAHKRKKLSGNLRGLISLEKLKTLGLADKRAEDLSFKDWIALVKT